MLRPIKILDFKRTVDIHFCIYEASGRFDGRSYLVDTGLGVFLKKYFADSIANPI